MFKSPFDSSYDRAYARSLAVPFNAAASVYFRAKYLGFENLPHQRFLAVGNHGSAHLVPDSFLWGSRYNSLPDGVPMRYLVHKMLHLLPLPLQIVFKRCGLVEANYAKAKRLLEAGYALTVYPGGDRETGRPWSQRNQIRFYNHTGYVRLALEAGVPIVPVVSCGGHEATIILDQGREFAKLLNRALNMKMHTFPLAWSPDKGLYFTMFNLLKRPLPAQITLSVLPPIHIQEKYGPEAAKDPQVVAAIDRLVRRKMQRELKRLSFSRIPIIG